MIDVFDVGRQHPPSRGGWANQPKDQAGSCVICFVKADDGSDFCTPCRDRLRGDV